MNGTLIPGRESQSLSLKQRLEDVIINLFYSQGPGARLANRELQELKASGASGIEKLQALVGKKEEKEGINIHG